MKPGASAQALINQITLTIDVMKKLYTVLVSLQLALPVIAQKQPLFSIPDTTIKSRVWVMSGFTMALYGGSLLALNQAWYKDYPKSGFHFIDDLKEWNRMDKFGHVYSAYLEAKLSRELWRWTGLPRKKQIWIGGLSGFAYQSVIEILDGFSERWGFSWSDVGANTLGTALMISQELAWDEQRIQLKFSYFPKKYSDPVLEARADNQFGKSFNERILKDYNAQTYWLSVNLRSFAKHSSIPKWLNIAVGYGADNMYGARANIWRDQRNKLQDHRSTRRITQFYLSPDIDFTKIPTKKRGVRILFQVLNMLKFPAPALELSSGGDLKAHLIHF